MVFNLTRLHAQRKITGSLLLLVFLFGLLLPVSVAALPLPFSPEALHVHAAPCNETATTPAIEVDTSAASQLLHHGWHTASTIAEAVDENCHEMPCTQCSYCSLLISLNASDLQLLVQTSVLATTGLAFTFSYRLDRPPKNPLI